MGFDRYSGKSGSRPSCAVAENSKSGPINLSSLRHSPGHLVHTLKGHTNVVSCMTLLPEEKGFISGSWDGTVRVSYRYVSINVTNI